MCIKTKDDKAFFGHCWPGTSVWLDYLNPEARKYWASLFSLDKYKETTNEVFIWNDMNEPAVFDTFEVTMPKDCLQTDGRRVYEHREVHNLTGLLMVSATYAGLRARSELRPFVLTRSFFAGAQRYAAVWTGDCDGSWEHLKLSLGMIQNLCAAGINFCGSDVPGFFGDVSDELLDRWYQASVFFPFMRGHAHCDTKRREPWLLSTLLRAKVRKTILKRYELLPYIYTMFYLCHRRSWPLVMPLWMRYRDSRACDIEDQFMFGTSFLVRPVCSEGKEVKVYLPANEVWYNYSTGEVTSPGELTYSADDLEEIPVFIKGGSIVPLYVLPSFNSTKQLRGAPVALVVALSNNKARGHLYLDDGETFKYQADEFSLVHFDYSCGQLTASLASSGYSARGYYKKVTVLGLFGAQGKVSAGKKLKVVECVEYDAKVGKLSVTLCNNAAPLMQKLELTVC